MINENIEFLYKKICNNENISENLFLFWQLQFTLCRELLVIIFEILYEKYKKRVKPRIIIFYRINVNLLDDWNCARMGFVVRILNGK